MSESLFVRLGETDGIRAIVEDVMAAHLRNLHIKSRYEAIDYLEHAKTMAAEFFAAGSGGPDPYTGRDMLTTHKGMNVSEQEFIAVVDDILWALEKHGRSDETKNDVLAILYSLKDEIIRV